MESLSDAMRNSQNNKKEEGLLTPEEVADIIATEVEKEELEFERGGIC